MNKKMALVLSALMATNTLGVYPTSIMASEANQGVVDVVTSEDLEEKVLETEEVVQTTTASAIVIQNLPTKTEYKLGEDLDLTGGAIAVTHEDDTTKVVALTDTLVNVSGYNKEQVGVQNLEVKYEELSTNFVVEVVEEPKVLVEPVLSKDKWTECEDGKWRKITEQPGLDFESMTVFTLDTTQKDNQFYAEKEGVDASLVSDYKHEAFAAERKQGLYYNTVQGTDLLYRLTGLDTETEYEVRYRINRETNNGWGTYWINKLEGSSLDPANQVALNIGENKGVIRLNVKDGKEKVKDVQFKLGTGQANQRIFIDYIEVVAVVDENPDAEIVLSKDEWTQCEDLQWRKIVNEAEFEFENMPLGEYEAEYKPTAPKLNKFYDSGSPVSEKGTFEIVGLGEHNKGLQFTPSKSGANNITYKTKIDKDYTYELNFKYQFGNSSGQGVNTTLTAQNNGQHIAGKAFDDNGEVNNLANPSYDAKSIQKMHQGKLVFGATESGVLDLKLWKGADAKVIIDSLELIAISSINPDVTTDKEGLIRVNDIIKEKNSGEFENWGVGTIPDFQGTATDFYKKGTVEITNEDAQNKNGHSAKIAKDSELILEVDELKANTAYAIFFKAKPQAGGKVEFRMSGFKDDTQFEYDNGDYNGGNWQTNDLGKAKMFNWVENLKISENKWNTFRYDFTTGEDDSNSVRARFNAVGADAYVDAIYLVERSSLKETSYELPSNNEISRGNRILIDEGLQFQSWITTDFWENEKGWIKQPQLEAIKELGITAVQYNDKPNFSEALHEQAKEEGVPLKWATAWGPKYSHISGVYQDSSDGKTGAPTEDEWENGYLTPNMGSEYLDDIVGMCIGDEEDYSDTLTQNIKNWFEVIREHYETEDKKILLHHNEVGNSPQDNLRQISTFNKDMLRKYVRTAKPDMITYDMYYFRERRIDQTKGGSVIGFYDDLNRYRIVAREGLDGTGEQPIPFGQYHYAWRTGPGAATALKRGDGWYEMTESQINLYSFATWTFGGKWMSNFRWLDDNPSYLFSDYKVGADGKHERYQIFDQFKELIRQSKNLGPHLVRLQNEDVAIIRGENKTKDGQVKTNNKPADNQDWSDIKNGTLNSNVFIKDVKVKNLGEQNAGLNGDVFISYFNILNNLQEEDKEVFTSTAPKYFMILNGLTAGDGLPTEMQQGSSYETRQEVKVTFELPSDVNPDQLKKVSRVDGGDTLADQGRVIDVPLTHLGGNTYEMTIVIGGGYADLFYWELGETKDTSSKQANESGKEDLIEGQKKYINEIEKRDLEDRTITIGHITGTNDLAPEARMGQNINTPATSELVDGTVINLEKYATSGGNIGAIGMRYFSQDLWEFRLDRIQKDNNVNLEFKEYNWTKEELLENVNKTKAGEKVEGMPDVLVVPDNWLWEKDGLVEEEAVLAAGDFDNIFDFNERKWNEAYTEMTTINGKTYGSTIDASMNPTGMFVNKTLLTQLGVTSEGSKGIYDLQRQDKWTFAELEQMIDEAIKNKIADNGIKLFADNEHLMRQLLVSAGVSANPYEFDATSTSYKKAMELYTKLKDNNLLMDGTLDAHMEAFSQKELVFLVAPYTEVAQHLAESYWYYEDNTIRKHETNFLNKWGEQTVTAPKDGEPWSVTVREQKAGKDTMKISDWNFMLFPKSSLEDEYRAILNDVSYPVILASTENEEDVAFVLEQLQEEYKGVETAAEFLKRGGVEYPDGRTWEPRFGDTARDLDTLRKVGLRDGYGDNLKASGVWDAVLYDLIQKAPNDYEAINKAVADYVSKMDESEKPEEVDKTKLVEVISVAKAKKESLYTTTSWKIFSEALKQAEAINVNEKATQAQVNIAINQLNQAMKSLVLVSNGSDDDDDVSSGNNTNPSIPSKKEEPLIEEKKVLPHLPTGDATVLEDIDSHWAKEAITQVVSIGIMVGDGESFRPNDSLTRAEMATMLQRIINSESTKSDKEIKDVIANEWYADAIYNMNTLGIMTGYADGTFAPKANISRQEMMVIVARLARYYGVDTKVVNQEEVLSSYTDQTDIATWGKEDIAWCVAQGVITGNDNALEVQREVTRAEIATILARMINK